MHPPERKTRRRLAKHYGTNNVATNVRIINGRYGGLRGEWCIAIDTIDPYMVRRTHSPCPQGFCVKRKDRAARSRTNPPTPRRNQQGNPRGELGTEPWFRFLYVSVLSNTQNLLSQLGYTAVMRWELEVLELPTIWSIVSQPSQPSIHLTTKQNALFNMLPNYWHVTYCNRPFHCLSLAIMWGVAPQFVCHQSEASD